MNRLIDLAKKYRELLVYVFFGGMTTVVNYAVYLPCLNIAGMRAAESNAIAWCVAVIFAFVTNKAFVFSSKDWSCKTVLPELSKFVGCRVGSGLVETAILWIAVDTLHWNGNLWKVIVSVLVIVMNYIFSKRLVFRNQERT